MKKTYTKPMTDLWQGGAAHLLIGSTKGLKLSTNEIKSGGDASMAASRQISIWEEEEGDL
jgi:hypothetical protein